MFNESREKAGKADARAEEARRWSTIGGTEHRRSTMGTGATYGRKLKFRPHWVVVLYLSPNNQQSCLSRKVSSSGVPPFHPPL